MSSAVTTKQIPRSLRYARSAEDHLRKIRALWQKTEASKHQSKKEFRGTVENEVDTYFNATLFNAFLHLDGLERLKSPSRDFNINAKNLRRELKLLGELGGFIIRKMKGFI